MSVRRKTQLLNVVNRTTRILQATWDGIPYRVYPGYVAIDDNGQKVFLEYGERGKLLAYRDERDRAPVSKFTVLPAKAIRDRRGEVIQFLPNEEKDALPYYEQFEWAVARAACLQNKRNQTEDPMDPRIFESLCGVLEWDNDIDHCEQVDGEALDRSLLAPHLQNVQRIGQPHRAKGVKRRRRFNIENYGGGAGNPTGMHIPDGYQPGR
jgi:hypothetical protein